MVRPSLWYELVINFQFQLCGPHAIALIMGSVMNVKPASNTELHQVQRSHEISQIHGMYDRIRTSGIGNSHQFHFQQDP